MSAKYGTSAIGLLVGLSLAGGCDSPSTGEGTLRIAAYGESFIEDEIPAEAVVDGWRIEFSSFLVSIRDVAADGYALDGDFVVELRATSESGGHPLAEMPMPSGLVEHVDYRVAPARSGSGGNAAAKDVEAMQAAGYSLWIRGEAVRGSERIAFDWGFATDTSYVACETNQTLEDGGVARSQLTLHSDHLFYDDLDSAEPNVAFDLIASADANADGVVSAEELRATDIRDQLRYQVGGRDIEELWSFIEAQTRTLGHIDGEGHCEVEA